MPKIVKNKDQISATVSPYLKKRCIEISQDPEFTSVSDVVSQALSEFIAKYDERKTNEIKKHEDNAANILIWALMKTEEGQNLIDSYYKSNKELVYEIKGLDNSKNPKLRELVSRICNSYDKDSPTES